MFLSKILQRKKHKLAFSFPPMVHVKRTRVCTLNFGRIGIKYHDITMNIDDSSMQRCISMCHWTIRNQLVSLHSLPRKNVTIKKSQKNQKYLTCTPAGQFSIVLFKWRWQLSLSSLHWPWVVSPLGFVLQVVRVLRKRKYKPIQKSQQQ